MTNTKKSADEIQFAEDYLKATCDYNIAQESFDHRWATRDARFQITNLLTIIEFERKKTEALVEALEHIALEKESVLDNVEYARQALEQFTQRGT